MKREKTQKARPINSVEEPIGVGDGLLTSGALESVASGSLNETELIAVLTEMCRCILAVDREHSHSAKRDDGLAASV